MKHEIKSRALVTGLVSSIFLTFSTSPVIAQDWNIIDGDERLSLEDMNEQLIGNQLVFEGGERAVFNEDGTYEFHLNESVYEYSYMFTDDGLVCITSADYGSRCDLMVRDSDGFVSINEAGDRFKASVE